MGKDDAGGEPAHGQEKDDIPTNSKMDLDAEQSSQVLQMMRGLIGSKDVDAMRMSVPAFVHNGDSGLERNFMLWQPALFAAIADAKTPELRMKAVATFVFSTFQGFLSAKNKKPLNPVMGEVFLARTAAGSEDIFYYAEQVSHHPPGSMQLYEMPGKKLSMSCTFFPVAGFTGTALRMLVNDPTTIHVGEYNEDYVFRMPAWYLRGMHDGSYAYFPPRRFFGKSFMDVVGDLHIDCAKTGLKAIINFKAKPWFFGEYRKVEGEILAKDGSVLYTLSGKWSETVTMKDAKSKDAEVVYDAVKMAPVEPILKPIEEQGPMESQRVWKATAEAIKSKSWREADRAKNLVEDRQRVYLREVDKGTIKHVPTLFTQDEHGVYHLRSPSSKKAAEATPATSKHPAHEFATDDLAGWMGALAL